jgi:amidase
MAIALPTADEVRKLCDDLSITLTDEEVKDFLKTFERPIAAFNAIDEMSDELHPVRYPRDSGYRPAPDENPLNGWARKCLVKGAPQGRLSGKTVALKDTIMLAGVPLTNGSTLLDDFIPPIDATVVERVLDAGGTITGLANCEALCVSTCSHTNATGPVHNPFRFNHSAGGSSSGCAALVAQGEVDLAIGGDQGGSIRVPSAFCGVYGMKPTWGLVPYTGILSLEPTLDHAGPISRTVSDNALLLEVLAGADDFDLRQREVATRPYLEARGSGIEGLRIGLIKEGFDLRSSRAEVDRCVRNAADKFASLGASISEVSIPEHHSARRLLAAIGMGGFLNSIDPQRAANNPYEAPYLAAYAEHSRLWRSRLDSLPPSAKSMLILAKYIHTKYGPGLHGKAKNIARSLRAVYDTALHDVDVLLLPTTTTTARELPAADAGIVEYVRRANESAENAPQFNLSHHPALSFPCGMVDSLPVGAMLAAKHFDEFMLYRFAFAFEEHFDWKQM